MPITSAETGDNRRSAGTPNVVGPPVLSLPKGGGAIRGIGEKFAANPVTGTGNLTVPIRVSPGRSDFSPQLTLSYDSGNANGPFGLGWSLSLPQITRRTDRGLPQYQRPGRIGHFCSFRRRGPGSGARAERAGATGHAVSRPRNGYVVTRYRPRLRGCLPASSDGPAKAMAIPSGVRFPKKTSRRYYGSTPADPHCRPERPEPYLLVAHFRKPG